MTNDADHALDAEFAAPVDLDNCEREPIHIPGAIQPHGVLITLTEPDLHVAVASANLADWFGVEADDAIGRPVSHVLGEAGRAVIDAARQKQWVQRFEVALPSAKGDRRATLHRSGSMLIVEVEVDDTVADQSSTSVVRDAAIAMQTARDLRAVADTAARSTRELLGFDRVMVYRFDADWNGEVIAEAKLDSLNTFLGLHYPATDIPAQARELYRRNWIRLIPDIGYTPVALVPPVSYADGAPLDLSGASLRSVSPIHVEYLSNMGVDASMSVSILVNGELWGLIACHHYSGRHYVTTGVRNAAEHLGQLISLRVAETLEAETRARSLELDAIADAAVQAFAAADHRRLNSVIVEHQADVLGLAGATGAVIRTDDGTIELGETPPATAVAAVVECWPDGTEVLESDDLQSLCPAAGVGGGAAAFALTHDRTEYVIWFRPELVRDVDWGGDPTNAKLAEQEGEHVRLSPRKSFERWRQVIRGKSAPWHPAELRAAQRFTRHLGAALLRTKRDTSALARDLQRVMRPEALPELDGLELSVVSEPANRGEIGGDWYDAFAVSERVALVIGDIAGHGLAAASEMAQLRNVLRDYLIDDPAPDRVLARVNQFMRAVLPGSIATVVCAIVDPATGKAVVSHAGHVPAIVRRGDTTTFVETAGDRLLGVAAAGRHVTEVDLGDDDVLVLYSDGLVDSRRRRLPEGLQRLEAVVAAMPIADHPAGLATSIVDASVADDHEDDVTVLVVRRRR